MPNEKDTDNKKITTIYEKILNKDKPFSLDKIQPNLNNHGDDIQENLDHIAEVTEKIIDNIKTETIEDVIKVDFKKKKSDK